MSEVKLFADINALDSLRNSDFDAVSAYGEVIDNSIEAGAKKIALRFDTRPGSRAYEHIDRVVFGDDGCGMDVDTLHKCMQIGWSSRFNSRGGIGRFGVGMTMAAIHECKRVDVYSKQELGVWNYTFIDLDKVKNGQMHEIPEPVKRHPPQDIESLGGLHSGTIVVWSNYDRQAENAARLKEETIEWIGRTYRYFIWDDGLKLTVNGQAVDAIDPLYARTELTAFPDDPQAEVYDEIKLMWPVDPQDAPESAPEESEITIRMSLLPEKFRERQFRGGTADLIVRHVTDNEGVSILRNRREVFYGHIPYWKAAGPGWATFDDIDRWWGCEICFDADLDRAFTVKNIKRGAVPNAELKKTIKGLIQPTRDNVLLEVRRVWNESKKLDRQKEADEDGLDRPGHHETAEKIAKATPTDKPEIDKGKDLASESDKFIDRNAKQLDEEQKSKLKALFARQPFTIMEDSWRGSIFLESSHLGGSSVLKYNLEHPFFEEVYACLEMVRNNGDAVKAAENLKTLLDLLLIAYAKGEAKFAADEKMSAETFIEFLRTNWGQYLNNYVRTWKEKEGSDQ